MKRYIFALLTAITIATSCCSTHKQFDISAFTISRYTPKYASGFDIRTLPDSSATLLQIITPWQGAVQNDHHLLIIDEGTEPPTGFSGAIIKGRAERIIAVSSSNIAMFDAIGEIDNIVGVSGLQYISNPSIQSAAERGAVRDVGYVEEMNFEALISLRPDLVLLYGVSGEEQSVTSKFAELGIEYIYVGDYAEQTALAKAEWMVAIGSIVGKLELSKSRFEGVEERYEVAKQRVIESESRPKVMLNSPYRDVWYLPSSRSYVADMIKDAGAEYIYNGNDSNETKPVSMEVAYSLMLDADYWINLGATTTSIDILKSQNPRFKDVAVVKERRLYNSTARTTPGGGSDIWESGVVNPDIVLLDMIKIFHPEVAEDYELHYYEQLK